MQIPDFQKLLSATSAGGAFKLCAEWFIFQRKIISEVYGEFKDLDTFKIYLYLCMQARKNQFVNRTKWIINKELKYATGTTNQSRAVDNALKWLETEGFIEDIRKNKQQCYSIKIIPAPDFHFNNKQFVKGRDDQLNQTWLKVHKQGYIMLPKEAITSSMLANSGLGRKTWTVRKLKTLILLYAYCWLEFYGGIDPSCVSIDKQGDLSLSKRFCFALKCSNTEATKTVISLIEMGHFKPVKCWFENDVYTGDVGTYNPNNGTSTVMKIILRPTYIIKHKLDSDVMKLKRGRVRI